MEHLPPVEWADVATKRDLDHLWEKVEGRFEAVDLKIEALENRLLATLRAEMNFQIGSRTRVMIFSLVPAFVGAAGVALAAARLVA